MATSKEESLPLRKEAEYGPREPEPLEQLGAAKIRDEGAASPRPTDSDVQPKALGLEPEIRSIITHRSKSVLDVAIGSLTIDGTERMFVLAHDVYKGLRRYEIAGGSRNVQETSLWPYAGREKDSDRIGKSGFVSSVCTLADGRLAVAIMNRRRVLVLRWSPSVAGSDGSAAATKGCWSVERKVKNLRCCPLRIDALGNDLLAVAGAEEQQESTSDRSSRSQVAMAWLTLNSVTLVQCGPIEYKVAALSLADRQLITASGDLYESGKILSYVVQAYYLPERRDDRTRAVSGTNPKSPATLTHNWTSEFNERVLDVCAVPCKAAVYVVLPDSRRVAALDLRTGEWLIDVLDCGSSRPMRIDITPRRQLPVSGDNKENEGKRGSDDSDIYTLKAAILYADSSISIHRVGAFD